MTLNEFGISIFNHVCEYGLSTRNSGTSYLGFYITDYLIDITDELNGSDDIFKHKYFIVLEELSGSETVNGRKICVVGLTVSFEDIVNGTLSFEDIVIGTISFEDIVIGTITFEG